jgi:hypothetical protein
LPSENTEDQAIYKEKISSYILETTADLRKLHNEEAGASVCERGNGP